MASNRSVSVVIQVVLAIVIVVLSYYLYRSITDPWEIVERQQELTASTRTRMDRIRTALIRYENVNDRFTSSLDSLVLFAKQDSLLTIAGDSVFRVGAGEAFVVDSLPFSPRSGRRFEYQVNDTSRVKTYYLKDPDSEDYIGTLEGDVTQLNAASWE